MLKHTRAFFTTILTPIARLLLRIGLTPNAVTIIGTIGVCSGALILYPTGHLFWGTLVITCFIFSDLLDGLMARISEKHSPLGGILDSVSDRIQDSAIFLGLLLYYFGPGNHYWIGATATICMILGLLVSYIKARAETEGYDANTGIAERPERIATTLISTGLISLGLPENTLHIALTLLATASLITITQRITTITHQTKNTSKDETIMNPTSKSVPENTRGRVGGTKRDHNKELPSQDGPVPAQRRRAEHHQANARREKEILTYYSGPYRF